MSVRAWTLLGNLSSGSKLFNLPFRNGNPIMVNGPLFKRHSLRSRVEDNGMVCHLSKSTWLPRRGSDSYLSLKMQHALYSS